MRTILFIAEPIGLCLGSLVAGILSCWLLWAAFKLVRHPEWGPPLVAVPAALALAGRLPSSEFLDMTLVFAAVAAIPFWSAGREWRAAWLTRDPRAPAEPSAPVRIEAVAGPDRNTTRIYPRYPAMTGCICEARRPAPAEIKKVASRIWRESFVPQGPDTSFATRRALLRAAKASLEGS
ncbi:hypothetical protein GCM10009087_50260 [Sphingomonas oligophenolica]|uniref:Uncharacterized protein n=1 Tax=Sphingomonas oligophenolica TaxID=301154 RepID=A0ABU9YCK1_9SPHN